MSETKVAVFLQDAKSSIDVVCDAKDSVKAIEAIRASGIKILGANLLEGRTETTYWQDEKQMKSYIDEKTEGVKRA